MIRPALLVLVASCSSPSHAPQTLATPPTPPTVPEVKTDPELQLPASEAQLDIEPATPLGAALPWTAHKCHRTVWPYYDADYTDDNNPVEPIDPAYQVSEGGCEGCGRSLDQKADELAKTRKSEGVCDNRNRDSLELALLRAPTPKPDATTPKAWDRKLPLEYHDKVRSVLALSAAEEKLLAQNGFVVPERLAYADYTRAYYDIHRGELPVYVTADSILHAVYASHDHLVAGIERNTLLRHLDTALGALHCGLPLAAKDYPKDVANDLDLYLTVARTLLAAERVPSELGNVDGQVASIVDAITGAASLQTLDIIGRIRSFDATQYMPRGHYSSDWELQKYFRVAMWLSRTEFNLVSRDSRSSQPGYDPDPSETPREAVVALALADLSVRTKALPNIAALDEAWTSFAGRREDVPLADLQKLRAKAGIKTLVAEAGDIAERLRRAIGDDYKRTVNVHPMPNVARLPAIATMLGPRITPDTVALGGLTNERGPDLTAGEVGFMLGHDRGLAYADPAVAAKLNTARDHMIHAPVGDDLYSNWLDAIRALSHRPQGAMPSFMDGQAFADLRLDTAIAAYGQLRHNHVLIAAQMYDQGGCEIPDGYVEPALETYKQLAEYAKRGRTTFRMLDPKDRSRGIAYFTRLERVMNVLVALSREELSNRPLSTDAKRFLSMIVEMREASESGYGESFPLATWDGWFIDLFPRMEVSFEDASFVADYSTFNRNGQTGVHYIGAKGPRLGVFVIDTGGKPRLMVGPVANAFQHTGPLAARLTDRDAVTVKGTAPWATSYTVAAAEEPAFAVEFRRIPRRPSGLGPKPTDVPLAPNILRIDSDQDLGDVTVDLLDHHFVAIGSLKVKVQKGRVDHAVPVQKRPIESLRFIRGDFRGRLDLDLEGHLEGSFGKPASGG